MKSPLTLLSVIYDLLVCESQYSQALSDHVHVTVLVVMALLVRIMNRAIAFDYETSFVTIEVRDVISELVLPPELETAQTSISKQLP